MANEERLDKFISNQMQISRNETKNFIRKGTVTVNDKVVRSSDEKINPESDIVKVNGEAVEYRKFIYLMMNKPQGVVCSTKDGLSPTVLSLVPEKFMRKGLFPAGRLDKDTEGFVLITDDGELSHRMLSPKSHVPKLYYCELEHDGDLSYSEKFKSGITLKTGENCLPAELVFEKDMKTALVTLNEGMFHQVKKMFEALDNKVTFLKRIKIGGVELDVNLGKSECREMLHKEVDNLLSKF
ncbi:MAG TPA: pseudouridine synthase [Oscillospiraceae bacterium]|nr:pseudouridine synthase [Oscillospiraceae bacterium]